MATLIKTDGTETDLPVPNAKKIRELIGADCLDIARTKDGRAMFVDDEGIAKNLPVNAKATALYRYGDTYDIRGDVVVFTQAETEADRG